METIIVFCSGQRMGWVTDIGAAEQTDVIEVQLQEVSGCESVCVCVCVCGIPGTSCTVSASAS